MWKVTEGKVCSEGISFLSYGIACENVVINDISTCKTEISEFVELLNKMGASEIHARDLVDDFLGK